MGASRGTWRSRKLTLRSSGAVVFCFLLKWLPPNPDPCMFYLVLFFSLTVSLKAMGLVDLGPNKLCGGLGQLPEKVLFCRVPCFGLV